MMHMRSFLALLLSLALIWAGPGRAAMSAAEFDAYTRGKTFTFGSAGQPYGAEEYLEDRRVRWSFLDGKCQDGFWYEEAGLICFVYEENPTPQCWLFERTGSGLRALFENRPGETELYEVEQSTEPMMCLGPEVGA